MTTLIETIRDLAAKRAVYNRTASEIRNMPLSVAHDLDIDPSEASKIAHRAVYGN